MEIIEKYFENVICRGYVFFKFQNIQNTKNCVEYPLEEFKYRLKLISHLNIVCFIYSFW